MITLSNGHSFQFMVASGALAFDGNGWPWEWPLKWVRLLDPSLFTIVTKTLTRHPRRGNLRWYNPFKVVRPLTSPPTPLLTKERGAEGRGRSYPTGSVNAIGLTNPGIDWWCDTIAPRLQRSNRRLIISLEAEEISEVLEMIEQLRESASSILLGVELNVSCPNNLAEGQRTTEKTVTLVRAIREASPWPLLLKVGVTHDYLGLAEKLRGVVEAYAINSVPWAVAFPEATSPLKRFGGGGVSGKIAQKWTWKVMQDLARRGHPVIGPSVWEFSDIDKLFQLGARAVSFGSIFLWHPWRPTRYVRRWKHAHA